MDADKIFKVLEKVVLIHLNMIKDYEIRKDNLDFLDLLVTSTWQRFLGQMKNKNIPKDKDLAINILNAFLYCFYNTSNSITGEKLIRTKEESEIINKMITYLTKNSKELGVEFLKPHDLDDYIEATNRLYRDHPMEHRRHFN
jgi:hypothetical protein